jgi:RNA-directed DNA polymerase
MVWVKQVERGAMFDAICEWGNLNLAFHNAARGKRRKPSAAGFELALADNLLALQDDLRSGQYLPGAYCQFFIREPKLRRISAAPFRDRVVHHAMCQLMEPLFEPTFSPHSYANRMGKGTHRALQQAQHFAQHFRYALRGDIVQHFACIDHALLMAKLAQRMADPAVLRLIGTVLASSDDGATDVVTTAYFAGDDLFAANRPRGLPIGNLTSQFWSNVYLNDFDWFVQRELRCTAYLRYVDDFVLFGDNKQQLWSCKQAIVARLAQERLRVHVAQMQVLPVVCGMPWLGFVVFPTHRLLKRRNAVKFTRRLHNNIQAYRAGHITFAELDASVQGWINHVRYADTWGLREQIFADSPIRS